MEKTAQFLLIFHFNNNVFIDYEETPEMRSLVEASSCVAQKYSKIVQTFHFSFQCGIPFIIAVEVN